MDIDNDNHIRNHVVAPRKHDRLHHDSLCCERCGNAVAVESVEINALLSRIARDYGFMLSGHNLDIYGTCWECREQEYIF